MEKIGIDFQTFTIRTYNMDATMNLFAGHLLQAIDSRVKIPTIRVMQSPKLIGPSAGIITCRFYTNDASVHVNAIDFPKTFKCPDLGITFDVMLPTNGSIEQEAKRRHAESMYGVHVKDVTKTATLSISTSKREVKELRTHTVPLDSPVNSESIMLELFSDGGWIEDSKVVDNTLRTVTYTFRKLTPSEIRKKKAEPKWKVTVTLSKEEREELNKWMASRELGYIENL